MSTVVYQINYVRQRADVYDEARVLAWLEALAAEGYHIAQHDESFVDDYERVLQQQNVSPGLSVPTREAVHRFCTNQEEELACDLYSLAQDFIITATIFAPDGSIMLTADDGYFTAGDAQQQQYDQFLTLVEVSYRQWHPIYGFDHGGGGEDIPSPTDALALRVRQLFNINVWGPEYVTQFGRSQVLSAPAWRVRPLDDGGVLVVPVPYVKEDWQQPATHDFGAVAKHLGLSA